MVNNLLNEKTTEGKRPSKNRGFEFEVLDVTGTRSLRARGIEPSTPAGSVARALAAKMDLPRDVPWALRDDTSGGILDEDKPLADQIATGSTVVLTPRAHLGGC